MNTKADSQQTSNQKLNEPALFSNQNNAAFSTIEAGGTQLIQSSLASGEQNTDIYGPVNIQVGSGEGTIAEHQSFGETVGNEYTMNMLKDE